MIKRRPQQQWLVKNAWGVFLGLILASPVRADQPQGRVPAGAPTSQMAPAAEAIPESVTPAPPVSPPLLEVKRSLSHGPVFTLEHARRRVLSKNPQAKNLDELVQQADTLIYRGWSILLPNLKAQASLTRNNKEVDLAAMGQPNIIFTELWNKSFGFSANMTLFNARSIPLIKKAYDYSRFTRLTGKRGKEELLLASTRAFYQVQAAKEMVKAAADNLKTAQDNYRESRARKAVGRATKIDLMRAEIQLNNAEKGLQDARDAVELAQAGLAALLGVSGGLDIIEPPVPRPVSGDVEALIRLALSRRVDLEAYRVSLTMAERDRQETWMKWVPTLDVTYAWNWTSAAGFSGEKDSWQLIFGAQWSILEGGARIAEVSERKSKMRVAQNELAQRALQIREQITISYLELAKSHRNVALAEKQVQLAEENHNLVLKQYRVGMATSLDLSNAASELDNRRVDRVLERLRYALAVINLNNVVGVDTFK